MKEDIINSKNQAIAQINEIDNLNDLEQIRIELFGRNGKITNTTKELKNLRNNFNLQNSKSKY